MGPVWVSSHRAGEDGVEPVAPGRNRGRSDDTGTSALQVAGLPGPRPRVRGSPSVSPLTTGAPFASLDVTVPEARAGPRTQVTGPSAPAHLAAAGSRWE